MHMVFVLFLCYDVRHFLLCYYYIGSIFRCFFSLNQLSPPPPQPFFSHSRSSWEGIIKVLSLSSCLLLLLLVIDLLKVVANHHLIFRKMNIISTKKILKGKINFFETHNLRLTSIFIRQSIKESSIPS